MKAEPVPLKLHFYAGEADTLRRQARALFEVGEISAQELGEAIAAVQQAQRQTKQGCLCPGDPTSPSWSEIVLRNISGDGSGCDSGSDWINPTCRGSVRSTSRSTLGRTFERGLGRLCGAGCAAWLSETFAFWLEQ